MNDPPIRRTRVKEQAAAAAQTGADAAAAREAGELPWVEPATHLLKMWSTTDLAEFNRLAEGFPAALRQLRSIVITSRQPPERHGGQRLRDPNLEDALFQINAAMVASSPFDPSGDRAALERRRAMGARFTKLLGKLRFRPK
jgi:hypothetical protein